MHEAARPYVEAVADVVPVVKPFVQAGDAIEQGITGIRPTKALSPRDVFTTFVVDPNQPWLGPYGLRNGRGWGPYGAGYYRTASGDLPLGPKMEMLPTAEYDFRGDIVSGFKPPVKWAPGVTVEHAAKMWPPRADRQAIDFSRAQPAKSVIIGATREEALARTDAETIGLGVRFVVQMACGAVGYFLWAAHPVLGFILAGSVGSAVIDAARGDWVDVVLNVIATSCGVALSLAVPHRSVWPALGFVGGHLMGAGLIGVAR